MFGRQSFDQDDIDGGDLTTVLQTVVSQRIDNIHFSGTDPYSFVPERAMDAVKQFNIHFGSSSIGDIILVTSDMKVLATYPVERWLDAAIYAVKNDCTYFRHNSHDSSLIKDKKPRRVSLTAEAYFVV